MKPGETITPGAQTEPSKKKEIDQESKTKPQSRPANPPPEDKSKGQAASTTWEYDANETEPDETASTSYVQPISWTASEYIAHSKGVGWYVLVFLVILGLAGIVYLVTDGLVSPIVIVIIGIAFTAFAGRPPQTLEYSVDGTGIHIGPRTYPYGRFRSFAILDDESVPTIMLIPLRRFDLPINLHFDAADADKIIDILGSHLPGEERNAPPVDRLMSKIHF